MEKPSWIRTLVAQLSLCFALYLALNIGQRENNGYRETKESRPLDLYFITVTGGFRPHDQQTRLLEQMKKITKSLKAKFVVNISELGDDDPFMQNGTRYFSSLKVPWYSTRASKGHGVEFFLKQIKLPYEQTLDIIGVDTALLQESMPAGSVGDNGKRQFLWLTKTLKTMSSKWRIVVGFHPLLLCGETRPQMEGNLVLEPIHHIFLKYGVNAYISRCGCNHHFCLGNIAYISNPNRMEEHNGKSISSRELIDGFLLHRVSSLEIETYFINTAGEAVNRTLLHQRGVELM